MAYSELKFANLFGIVCTGKNLLIGFAGTSIYELFPSEANIDKRAVLPNDRSGRGLAKINGAAYDGYFPYRAAPLADFALVQTPTRSIASATSPTHPITLVETLSVKEIQGVSGVIHKEESLPRDKSHPEQGACSRRSPRAVQQSLRDLLASGRCLDREAIVSIYCDDVAIGSNRQSEWVIQSLVFRNCEASSCGRVTPQGVGDSSNPVIDAVSNVKGSPIIVARLVARTSARAEVNAGRTDHQRGGIALLGKSGTDDRHGL
jgi:hypothetical protein